MRYSSRDELEHSFELPIIHELNRMKCTLEPCKYSNLSNFHNDSYHFTSQLYYFFIQNYITLTYI